MRFKPLMLLMVMMAALCAPSVSAAQPDMPADSVRSALKRLDKAIADRKTYIERRSGRIDSLLTAYRSADGAGRLRLSMLIGDNYAALNNDSCLAWYARGRDMALASRADSMATAFTLKHATYMPLAGFTREAADEFLSVVPDSLGRPLQRLYHDSGRQMYSYLASFYRNYPEVSSQYQKLSSAHQDSLISLLDSSDLQYLLNAGESHLERNELDKARTLVQHLLQKVPMSDNAYARGAHMMADIASRRGNNNERVYYLALSALSDTQSATLEITSLQELGTVLFDQGDIERAHTYLTAALENAVACNASMRMIQISQALPLIIEAHQQEVEAWRQRVTIVIVIMALILLGLIVVLIVLRFSMRKERRLRAHLSDANKVKEAYISRFLNLCSIYMDKLNQFNKLAVRKLSAGNADELLNMLKSGKFVNEQTEDFYQVFDEAFLHIYPHFVDQVNALLRPDARYDHCSDFTLNPELRILAFMRLGVNDGARIARVLNYSVNTIYAYRNKVKGRALNRDTFEDDVMKINE